MSMSEDPWRQGCIATIYRHFLLPLTRFKPDSINLRQWWEFLFDTPNRELRHYVVQSTFRMPGLYYERPSVKIQGIGPRRVHRHDQLVARLDARAPDAIDVEWIPRDGEPHTFQITAREWQRMQRHLKLRRIG